ncbi:PA domain-containing protein [Nocardioides sp. Soil796]|uniref:PA domain-containing protein n=1 Tax=Nocardioides sp. Soil796 TaxID=1736412 RepID=UPI00070A0C6E|nr:PA domain-containing protein [Nocardioides sp. Soil796]KRF12806.1 hypothetical protein ASH02_14870 [Nocardioides sp. Soil796]
MNRRTPRLIGVAALCAALSAAGQLPLSGASGASGVAGPDRLTGPASRSAVVGLGQGDRVRLTPLGQDGRQVIEPLRSQDGTTPGLLVSTDDHGTTLRATDGSGEPTLVDGTAPTTTRATAADLVELNLDAIARDGRAASADVTVYDVVTGATQAVRRIPGDPDAACSTKSFEDSSCVLVPPGTYSVMAFVNTMPAARPGTARERTVQNVSLVGDPEVAVEASRDFTFDARRARPVEVRTPDHRTKVNADGAMQVGYSRTAANGRKIVRQYRPSAMLDQQFFMEAAAPVRNGALETLTRLRLEAPDIELTVAGRALRPEYYDQVWFSDVITDFPMYDGHDRLRVVDVGHATPADLAGKNLRGAIAVAERTDDLSVAEQSNAAAVAGAALFVVHNDGPGDNDDPNGTGTKLQVPTLRLDRAEGEALKAARGRVEVRGETASHYLYDLVLKEQGSIPKDLSYVFRDRDLAAQVREIHGQPTVDSTFSEAAYQYQPEDTFSISTMYPFRGGARTRVEHRVPDPDTRWTYATVTPQSTYNALFPHPPVLRMTLSDPDLVAYESAGRTTKPVGTAPVTAAPSTFRPMERSGNQMRVAIDGFVDADGNHGTSYSTNSGMSTLLQIRADGELVGETDNLPSGVAVLPAGDSRVEVSFVADNPQPWAELSTHTESVWTFASTTVPAGEVVTQPVILADYDVDVDLRNRVLARGPRPVGFDVRLAHAPGAAASPISDVTVEASYDDGRTWRAARATGRAGGRWHVELPRGTGHVSLRLHAADTAGSTLDQTIVRAWYVAR